MGVEAGGGVATDEAAMVAIAAGTARAAIANLCQFTSLPPDAGFVAVRVLRGDRERQPKPPRSGG